MGNAEMEMQKRIFSKNLKFYLDYFGKTQVDLQKLLNVSSSTTSYWINGAKIPRMDKIQAIADWLHIQKSDLLEDKPLMNTVQDNLIADYLKDAKLREFVLFAGGMLPKDTRDKLIDSLIATILAVKK